MVPLGFWCAVILPSHLHDVLEQELLDWERQTGDVDHCAVVLRFDAGKVDERQKQP